MLPHKSARATKECQLKSLQDISLMFFSPENNFNNLDKFIFEKSFLCSRMQMLMHLKTIYSKFKFSFVSFLLVTANDGDG